jgi:metal-responsive CopG/Arc/MetJ family transcriptional regulator
VAKVMISFPDELLERLDAEARRTGKTRSGLIQELAKRELLAGAEERARLIRSFLAQAKSHGGNAAEAVRADRRSH